MTEAYQLADKIYVPCDFCKVVHWFHQSDLVNNSLPCRCQLQVKKGKTIHSPYESGFEVELVGEYTEEILKQYLKSWNRKHPNPSEDIFF